MLQVPFLDYRVMMFLNPSAKHFQRYF
jgi:hypothetical protein